MSVAQVERRIADPQRELFSLGSVHPGSITKQFSVYGQLGCHCKDPKIELCQLQMMDTDADSAQAQTSTGATRTEAA